MAKQRKITKSDLNKPFTYVDTIYTAKGKLRTWINHDKVSKTQERIDKYYQDTEIAPSK